MLRAICATGKWVIQLEPQGYVDGAFSRVGAAFVEGFEAGRDVGAALAVFVDGRPMVDVWAGHRDRRRQTPWERDTLCCLFSATKGVTTLCVLQAADAGYLSLDEPIARWWPEFAVHDKASITIRDVLSHRSGLVGFHRPVAPELLCDWTATCAELADETPWWTPGERHGYHARTFGYLLGEALRRATGETLAGWLRRRIAGPLELDLHIGLESPDLERCADMLPARLTAGATTTPESELMRRFYDTSTPTGAAFQNPALGPGYMNRDWFRRAEIPAMNGHGTARGLARLYSEAPRLVSPDLLADACRTHSLGWDEVLCSTSHFGAGFMLQHPDAPLGRTDGTFGHVGAGGSVGFLDPVARLSFCFVMNQMERGVVTGSASAQACLNAAYDCL
jgi:CubicO group peptidase (beta-lactamase class C family)